MLTSRKPRRFSQKCSLTYVLLYLCFLNLLKSTYCQSPLSKLKFIFEKKSLKTIEIFETIRIWNGSLAISWVTLALIFQGIKSDLICSQWRSKIS